MDISLFFPLLHAASLGTAVFLSLSLCTRFIHLPGINFNQVFTF